MGRETERESKQGEGCLGYADVEESAFEPCLEEMENEEMQLPGTMKTWRERRLDQGEFSNVRDVYK